MGKLVALIALLIVLALLGLGGALWWSSHSAQGVAVKAETKAGTATVAAGQAQAQAATLRIVTAGEARDRTIAAVQQENAHAILTAPGAGDAVDPGLVDRLRAGLCHYASLAADPGCSGLRQPDPAELSPAGPVDPVAGQGADRG